MMIDKKMLNKKTLQAMADGKILRSSPNDGSDDDLEASFLCPHCHGSYFGSEGHGTTNVEYHCHDQFETGCCWSGTKDEGFIQTYSCQTLAAELLTAYKKIEDLEK